MSDILPPVSPSEPRKKSFLIYGLITGMLIIVTASLAYFLGSKNPTLQKLLKISRKTPDTFKITDSSPKEFDDNFPVVGQPTFVFNQRLDVTEADLKKYFSLSPQVEGTWHLTNNNQVVYFSSNKKQKDSLEQIFPYDSLYSVTIQKGLPADSGKTIGSDKKFTFRTHKDPRFKPLANQKLLNTFPNKLIKITFTGAIAADQGDLAVHIRQASTEDVTTYFKSPDHFTYLYEVTNTMNYGPVDDIESRITTDGNAGSFITLPPMKPGLYYVTLTNQFGKDDLFINVSSHVNQAFKSRDQTHVWVSDMNGKSIPGIETTLYNLKKNVQKLASNKTNASGVTTFKDNADLLITKKDSEQAITYFVSSRYEWFSKFKVFSYTDRPVYRPGDTVHYKAVIRARDNGVYVPAKDPVYLSFLTSGLKPEIEYKELIPDENGTVTMDLTLPLASQELYPTISLYFKNDNDYREMNSLSLQVESYRKPDLDISVETGEVEYISSDSATMTITAKTLYGAPMSGMNFIYRVIANNYTEVENRALEYLPGDSSNYYGEGKELVLGSGTFDKKGKSKIVFSTDLKELEDSQIITVEVAPKINASPSIATISKLVHRGTYAVFYRNIQNTLENGVTGTVLALNHEQVRQPLENMELTVGLYKQRADYTNEFLTEQKVTTNPQGQGEFKFPLPGYGSYSLITRGTDERGNQVTGKYSFYAGPTYRNDTNENKGMNLVLNSLIMNTGDSTNGITVTSDFDMQDVAIAINTTSEPEKTSQATDVRNFMIKQVNGRTFSLPISLDPGVELPFSVQVFTVSDGIIAGSSGAVSINAANKRISTNIKFNKKETKPGETIQVTIENKDAQGNPISADNSLSLIDSAILQIGRISGNIHDAFFKDNLASYVNAFNSTEGINRYPGGGGGGCFLEGTLIKTPEGTKAIEDIVTGDAIVTRTSEIDATLAPDTVTKTYKHIVNEYLTINGILQITPIHRIFLNNQWTTAGNARVGDFLLNENGTYIKINAIVRHLGQFTVYNLTTQNTHTFIAQGFYVHNEKGDGPRQNFTDTVYWNPHIRTDSSGRATVDIKLPDNITTYTAQVYSNRGSQFGQAAEEIISKRDFVIIPVIANYYYTGDKASISALVQNGSGKSVSGKLILKIPEMNVYSEQNITVGNEDFESVKYKIDLEKADKEISVQLDFKDSSGSTLDSVLMRKQILPRDSVKAGWESFAGSASIEFAPPYPKTDFNTLELRVQPHLAEGLLDQSFSYDYSYSSGSTFNIDEGMRLYTYSYLLSRSDKGEVPPDVFPYAQIKNSVRSGFDNVLRNSVSVNDKNSIAWPVNQYDRDSVGAVTLILTKALEEAAAGHMLDEVTNVGETIKSARSIATHPEHFHKNELIDAMLKRWVARNNDSCDDAGCVAAQVLAGDTGAIKKLETMAIQSASDRLIWDTSLNNFNALPAIALLEKGTPAQAEKAFIGILSQNQYGADRLSLLAGVIHAIKNNLPFERSSTIVTVNGTPLLDTHKSTNSWYFNSMFATKNIPDGKIHIKVEDESGLPTYTTVTTTQYGSIADEESHVLRIKKDMKRSFRTLPKGEAVANIPAGESGLVEIKIANPYTGQQSDYTSGHESFLIDAVSPQFMILDQYSGNSPQFNSIFSHLYPNVGNSSGYTSPYRYSDQFISFNTATKNPSIVLPYAVWNIADGSYYQPKTSLVYPLLGVIVEGN